MASRMARTSRSSCCDAQPRSLDHATNTPSTAADPLLGSTTLQASRASCDGGRSWSNTRSGRVAPRPAFEKVCPFGGMEEAWERLLPCTHTTVRSHREPSVAALVAALSVVHAWSPALTQRLIQGLWRFSSSCAGTRGVFCPRPPSALSLAAYPLSDAGHNHRMGFRTIDGFVDRTALQSPY